MQCSNAQVDRTFETSSVRKEGATGVCTLDFDMSSLEPSTTGKNDRVRTEKRRLGNALANLRRVPPPSRLTVYNTAIITFFFCLQPSSDHDSPQLASSWIACYPYKITQYDDSPHLWPGVTAYLRGRLETTTTEIDTWKQHLTTVLGRTERDCRCSGCRLGCLRQ